MILLNSDTETKPTRAMRSAIAQADVGDEQRREDPTVNALTARVARLLGQEAAIFMPTGTMCNVVAINTHTQPGQLLLAERSAHVLRAEGGGSALISGVMTEPVATDAAAVGNGDGIPGTFTVQALNATLARASALPRPYSAPAGLLCVEQTHNFCGGTLWPRQQLQDVCDAAHQHNMPVHMDGARLMNAVTASGLAADQYGALVDSVWMDFTKGLGAPIGSVLAGSNEFIERAWLVKTAVGGAMRQAGIAAAACLYALDHHVERLADDHHNATRLAEGLLAIPGISLVYGPPQTNIVFFDVEGAGMSAADFAQQCTQRGVRLGPVLGYVRAVTHLDISRADIDTALHAMADVIQSNRPQEKYTL